MPPDPSATEDVQALFKRINQSDLPYRVFERTAPPAPKPTEPARPDTTAFLRAYAPKPDSAATPSDGPIPLKALFAILAERGRREPG